ncbi:MAG: M20/M25/M40 family metallo-hydrolase [Flavobacteriales bacterium]|nr:M20/M25/M40 family metallo-hydrolase [Flavobacteriales bacterium]
MLKNSLFFLVFFLVVISAKSQDVEYAKKMLDTLSSSYFEGRGAVNNGEKKAADFIAKEYKKLGLKSFQESFLQHFNYNINTFSGKLEVAIDGKKLIPGKDYIVGAASSKLQGEFDLVHYNSTNLPTKKELQKLTKRDFFFNKIIVIDDEGIEKDNEVLTALKINVFNAIGIILLENKLTQSIATSYEKYAVLHILRAVIDRNARKVALNINQQFISNFKSQNVIGYIEGTELPDSIIAVSAHYDHLGRMGDEVYFPGANDNAAGVAMLLNFAKYFSEHLPKKTIVFMAFGAEESGIIGSRYFVGNPTFELKRVNFLINLDVIGTGTDGVMVVNGADLPQAFALLESCNEKKYVLEIKKRKNAPNSDHFWFAQKGIPAFFIYGLGGGTAYHDIDDTSDKLQLEKYNDVFSLIRDFILKL